MACIAENELKEVEFYHFPFTRLKLENSKFTYFNSKTKNKH